MMITLYANGEKQESIQWTHVTEDGVLMFLDTPLGHVRLMDKTLVLYDEAPAKSYNFMDHHMVRVWAGTDTYTGYVHNPKYQRFHFLTGAYAEQAIEAIFLVAPTAKILRLDIPSFILVVE